MSREEGAPRAFRGDILQTMMLGLNIYRPDITTEDLTLIKAHFLHFVKLVPVGLGSYKERRAQNEKHLKVPRRTKERLLAERGGCCDACKAPLSIDDCRAHHTDYNDIANLDKVAMVHEKCHAIIHAIAGMITMWFPAEMGLTRQDFSSKTNSSPTFPTQLPLPEDDH